MPDLFGFDAFSPREIAARVETVGVVKARLPLWPMLMLGILAGAFIGLGSLGFTLVKSDPTLGFATAQLLGGAVFSLGLFLVLVAGAELFTGNNLLVMAWADGRITTRELLRNWLVVCTGNCIGAAGLAVLVFLARHPELNGGLIAGQTLKIAAAKASLSADTAFFRGILCNVLVCMAVWMAFAGRSVIDKAVAVFLPVTLFVAAGFEHSIANLYFFPLAMLLQASGSVPAEPAITLGGVLGNLLPVIAGNLVGGSILVGLVYRTIYRPGDAPPG